MQDPEFGSELRRLATPEFKAKERRKTLYALSFGVVIGLASLGDALYARGHGGMVDGGSYNHFLKIPWWAAALIGLFVLCGTLYGLWKTVTQRD